MVSLALTLQLLASFTTILGTYSYGNKSLWGPRFGIGSQVFWWLMMFHESLWGLMPLNVVMLVMHVLNYKKWKTE